MKVIKVEVPEWVDEEEVKRIIKIFFTEKPDFMDFAGLWKNMSEEEAEEFKATIKRMWDAWKI
ncbi:hypothetical protein [Thermococcus sp.]